MSHPYPMFGTQDLKDDDAKVIDDYLIETNAPPAMDDATEPIPPTPTAGITPTTRLISRELRVDPAWDAVLAVPADEFRKQLLIKVLSPTAVTTDGVRVGSDRNTVAFAGRLVHGSVLQIDNHTGALWVYPQALTDVANSAVVCVEIWSITK